MKGIWKRAVSMAVLASMLLLAGCGNGSAVDESNGAVKVNDVVVSKNIMDLYFNNMKQTLSAYGLDPEAEENKDMLAMMEQQAYDTVVSAAVIRAGAQAAGITATDEEVDEFVAKQKESSFPGGEGYEDWLTQMGMTEDDVRWIWETQLYDEKLYDSFAEQTTVTDEEAKAAYEAAPDDWNTRKVSHILYKFADDSEEAHTAAFEKAKAAIARLDSGEDFAEIAKAESEDTGSAANGGAYDQEFTINNEPGYVDSYILEAFDLAEVGDYSNEPVESDYGFHVMKLDGKKDTFEQLKTDIIQKLTEDKAYESYNNYLNEFYESATIEQLCTFQYYGVEDETQGDGQADGTDGQGQDNAADGEAQGEGEDQLQPAGDADAEKPSQGEADPEAQPAE